MWRDVKVVGVGNVARGVFSRALVRGDVDPHCSGLGAVQSGHRTGGSKNGTEKKKDRTLLMDLSMDDQPHPLRWPKTQ